MSIGLRAFIEGLLVASGGVVTVEVKLPWSVEKWKENWLWNQADFGIRHFQNTLPRTFWGFWSQPWTHTLSLSFSLSHLQSHHPFNYLSVLIKQLLNFYLPLPSIAYCQALTLTLTCSQTPSPPWFQGLSSSFSLPHFQLPPACSFLSVVWFLSCSHCMATRIFLKTTYLITSVSC